MFGRVGRWSFLGVGRVEGPVLSRFSRIYLALGEWLVCFWKEETSMRSIDEADAAGRGRELRPLISGFWMPAVTRRVDVTRRVEVSLSRKQIRER